jgi:hypothetical protein
MIKTAKAEPNVDIGRKIGVSYTLAGDWVEGC